MNAGPWSSRADFESWWRENVDAFNRLSVVTPPRNYEEVTNPEWHRVARKVEEFQRKNQQ